MCGKERDRKMSIWGTVGKIACGFAIGTAGVKILSSKDAKKCYTHITAAVLRCKDTVMETVTNIKENCEDISADAKEINEERYEKDREREIENAKAVLENAANAKA